VWVLGRDPLAGGTPYPSASQILGCTHRPVIAARSCRHLLKTSSRKYPFDVGARHPLRRDL